MFAAPIGLFGFVRRRREKNKKEGCVFFNSHTKEDKVFDFATTLKRRKKSSSTPSGSVKRSALLLNSPVYLGRCAKTGADSQAEPLNRTSKGGKTGRAACGKLMG